MTLVWPIHALPCRDIRIDPAFRNTRGNGGAVAYGEEDIVASDAGYWVATLAGIAVNTQARRKAFRAIQTLLEGGLTAINIPLCRADQPVPDGAVEAGLYDEVSHDDDALFDDGAGYVGQVIDVTLAASAARRATTLQVDIGYAAELEPPNHFSLGDRLYRIKSITTQSDTAATFKIWPPLREAATEGDVLNFDNPVCRMRLASDSEMDLELSGRRFALPTVRFVEDL